MPTYKRGYACPYCNREYEKEYQARDCAQECVDIESPNEIDLVCCDMCGEICANDDDAEACEAKHKDMNDQFYQKYLVKENFKRLEAAAKNPYQSKLEEKQ